MEATVPRARRLAESVTSHGVDAMIAYRLQPDPAVRQARELVATGYIGDPVHIHAQMSQRLLELIPDTTQWRLDPELSGGATVIDIGIYPINTTRFLLDADPTDVQSHVSYDATAFEDVGEEDAEWLLHFPNGISATWTASQNAYRSSHLRVTGTEGEILLEPAFRERRDGSVQVSVDREEYRVQVPQGNQMTEAFDYFAHCLLTGESPYPDVEHGLVDMLVIRAMYEAAETGETVAVPSV